MRKAPPNTPITASTAGLNAFSLEISLVLLTVAGAGRLELAE
jgi:hypothetical protein